MGSSLTGNKIKDTYKSLIKVSDSGEAGTSAKQLSDGNGNDLGLYVDTDGVFGIGAPASFTLDISSATDGVALPVGTTANRPTGSAGIIRYNSTLGKLEYYDTTFKQIASENYVSTAINNLIDSAPNTLDTLNEIAAALNDDPDFYNTITTLINGKEATITGAATTITSSDLTADKAVVSNASGKIAVSVVTSTELGHLSGVSSAIQTQIDGKQDTLTAGNGIDITNNIISTDLTNLVDTGAIQADAVTAVKMAQFDDNLSAATAGDILVSNGTDFDNVTVSGDITINSSGVTSIGSDKIDEDNLKVTNTPTDGYVLTYDSATSGFTWEEKFDGDITGIVAGAGLTGDATSGEATLAVGAGTGITVNANDVQISDGGVDTLQLADDSVTSAKIEDNIQLAGTESVGIPAGTTAQRPVSPTAGMFRYNTTDGQFEGYTTEWGAIAGSGGGSAGTLNIEQQTFNGDGSTVAFTLSSTCTSKNNLQVFIDGVYQSKDNFSVSGTTLTFTTAPSTGTANIEVIHLISVIGVIRLDSYTGDGSDTTFDLSNTISNENNTQVFIDGVYQSKSNYSTSGTTITFSTAPPNGSAIEVVHIVPTSSGGGGGISWNSTVQTSAFTAISGEGYFVNTTSAAITVTLPSSPSAGDEVTIVDYAGTADTNNITITSSDNINGSSNNVLINYERGGVSMVYVDATQGWIAYNATNETATGLIDIPPNFSVDYLIVAGGGGGGVLNGGGGGGGGLLTSSISLVTGNTYTVTVGAGGSGAIPDSIAGTNGGNSVLSGTGITTITSLGGGSGGTNTQAATSGGSGGGASNGTNTGGAGTVGQGNRGGNTSATGPSNFAAAGGGGAGAAGADISGSAASSNGGVGLASSITGTSTYYAGGGGGNANGGTSSSGGLGGGGNGIVNSQGTSGTNNTGGGGGGSAGANNGGAGGSGVVILRYPNTYTISETTSPAVLTFTTDSVSVSGYKITTFTSGENGTIQFS